MLFRSPCRTPHLTEDEIKEVFLQALNKLLTNKETVIQNLELLKTTLFSTSDLEQELCDLESEIEVTKELYRKGISSGPITDSSRLTSMQNHFSEILEKRNNLKDEITSRKNKRLGINRFIRTLKDADEQVSEFSDELFVGLLDHMTVYSKACIAVTFKGGQEIKITKD